MDLLIMLVGILILSFCAFWLTFWTTKLISIEIKNRRLRIIIALLVLVAFLVVVLFPVPYNIKKWTIWLLGFYSALGFYLTESRFIN